MKTIITLGLLVMLVGCGPDSNLPLNESSPTQVSHGSRFTVTRVGIFPDDLVYNSRRSIFILHDEDTGVDYVGISGVGISEVGHHPAGKSQVSDER